MSHLPRLYRPSPRRCAIALLALLPVAVIAHTPMTTAPSSNTRSFHLAASCARAFPLFTALGEKQWTPGWSPDMLSGDTERGSVFRTRHHGGATTIWIVTDYDPRAGRVSYARLVEGSNIGLVDVRCSNDGNGSLVQVTYALTGVNAKGAALVADFLADDHYEAMITEWKQALTTALSHPE